MIGEVRFIFLEGLKIFLALFCFMNSVPVLVYAERRVAGFIQDRVGPNRVGPLGLLQPFADALKLLMKEDLIPAGVDRALYILGPMLAFLPAALAFAVVPFGNRMTLWGQTPRLQIADANVGILFVFAVTSLGVYGLAFAGWASNNKFSLLGSLRASAQLISYEIAMGLALISILMVSGTVSMNDIVLQQADRRFLGFLPGWNIFCQPLAFLIFWIAAFAENNRLPFDLPEAEPELIGGYHTEYAGMKFSMFFMGEYLAMVSMSGVMVTLFLGGWHFPGIVDTFDYSIWGGLKSMVVFAVKTGLLLFIAIMVRWTLPRFRYDQLMRLGWNTLVPLALMNVIVTGVLTVEY